MMGDATLYTTVTPHQIHSEEGFGIPKPLQPLRPPKKNQSGIFKMGGGVPAWCPNSENPPPQGVCVCVCVFVCMCVIGTTVGVP